MRSGIEKIPKRFRFIHSGDLHLGFPFDRQEGISPEEAARFRAGLFSAFDRLIDATISSQADCLLLAGDVFDRNFHCTESRARFLEAMRRLEHSGIRVLISAGNHDPLPEWDIAPLLPGNVRLFGVEPEVEHFTRDGVPAAVSVCGISHGSRTVAENLVGKIANALATEPGLRIGLVHANVGVQPYAAPVTLEELTSSAIDYWALGHKHQRELLAERPMTVYCGSIFRLGHEENKWYAATRITMENGAILLEFLKL